MCVRYCITTTDVAASNRKKNQYCCCFEYIVFQMCNGISRQNTALLSSCIYVIRKLVNLELVNLYTYGLGDGKLVERTANGRFLDGGRRWCPFCKKAH